MGFDIADGCWPNTRHLLSRANYLGLGTDAGSRVADLLGTVIVDGRAFDHGIDEVPIGQGIIQALQHHNPQAAACYGSGSLSIKGATMSVRRIDAALLVKIAYRLR